MKTIISWLKIVGIPRNSLLLLFLFLVVDAIHYVVLPLSFAKIATSATVQNFSLTSLWAGINFMLQILAIVMSFLSHSKILTLTNHIKNKLLLSFDASTAGELSNFLSDLYKSTGFVVKIISILISSALHSFRLFLYLFFSIFVCTTVGWFERRQYIKNSLNIQNSFLWGNLLWTALTYSMILFTIYELRMQSIGLTAFLFLFTFINTHLLRPNFNEFFSLQIKHIKTLIEK